MAEPKFEPLSSAMDLYRQTKFMLQRDFVIPGYSHQYDAMESASESDFDSDDTLDLVSEHADIDVNSFLGRAVAIWLYNQQDSVTLFTPRPGDNMSQIMQYIQHKFGFNNDLEKFVILEAGQKLPKEVTFTYELKQGSVIMVFPKKNVTVSVEINQLDFRFPISADPMCTVFEVKTYIKRVKGIPIDQQDILYRDTVLENSRRLYEYRVTTGTIMHVLIQVHFDLLVNIETFWGKTYKMYVDKCSTGSDILYRVFGRTFSKHGKEHVTVHELYVPIHVLVFQHNKKALHWDYCLGFYGVKTGDTLVLNTIGRKSDMNMQTLLVVTELGENYEVTVSQFDRWSVVAFVVHGHTDVPVDLIRLYRKEAQLDFTQAVGVVAKNSLITMNIAMTNVNKDMMFGIPIKINIGNGIIENMKVVPNKKVKDVKERLEEIGVPNASMYEIGLAQYKLPNHARLKDVIKDFKKTLFLKVEKFPVFLHAPDGVIYKSSIDVNHSLKDLQHKIEMKSGHAISSCRLIMSGQEMRLSDDANLYDNGISTRNSIFVEAAPMFETFFIMNGKLLIKLRIPVKPTHDMIKRSIWSNRDVPEGSITCLQTFLFWFFATRISRKFQLPKRHKRKKQIPAAHEPLHTFSEREDKHLKAEKKTDCYETAKPFTNRRKYYTCLPPLQREESDEDARTWPISLQRPVKSQRRVEMWMNSSHDEPKARRKHTRIPSRKQTGHHRKYENYHQQKNDIHHSDEKYHIVPRWVNNLKNHETKNMLAPDTNGMVYKSKEQLQPSYHPTHPRVKHRRRQHHQGDGTNATYFNTKRMFDKQETDNDSDDYSSFDDSDSFDGRPYIVLR